MRATISKLTGVGLLIGAGIALGNPVEVRALSVFCPSNPSDFNGGDPINLTNGACTNGKEGAFSGAALASQALSELSETTTQETTKNTIDAVTNRRAQEEQRCAEGFLRVDGACRPIPKPVAAPVAAPAPAPVAARPRGPSSGTRA